MQAHASTCKHQGSVSCQMVNVPNEMKGAVGLRPGSSSSLHTVVENPGNHHHKTQTGLAYLKTPDLGWKSGPE